VVVGEDLVAVVSMEEGSVVVSTVAALAVAVLQAESACAAVEDRDSLHLGILHLGSLSIMDELADP